MAESTETAPDGPSRNKWAVGSILMLMMLAFTIGECYPVSSLAIFDRYASAQSRVLARGEDGRVTRVTAFDRYNCPRVITLGDVQEAYAEVNGVPSNLDSGSVLYVRGHVGVPEKAVRVDIILRTIRFDADTDGPEIEDRVLQECKADSVGADWELVKIWTIVRR